MNLFSISQLSQFSGIKPHTIRVWEQRYHALKPNRSEGNTRYYDSGQLRRLLNIVSLMEAGYKISELGALEDKELFKLIGEMHSGPTSKAGFEYFIAQIIAAGMNYDEVHFEKIIAHCLLKYGMKDAYTKIIGPVLTRLGLMWASDTIPPAHEHFNSNLFKQKLYTAIDALPPYKTKEKSWLLFLPEDEFHEIGLLFAQYLLRWSGRKTIYLGGNLPFHSLAAAVDETAPENLLLFLVHHDLPEETQKYLDRLTSHFSDQHIFLAGNEKLISQLNKKNNVYWLKSVEDLENQLLPSFV